MVKEIYSVQTVNQCIEMVKKNAANEQELIQSWFVHLKELFKQIDDACIFGETVRLKRLELIQGTVIVAVCRRSNRDARMTLDSIEIIGADKTQKLWLRAWVKWSSKFSK